MDWPLIATVFVAALGGGGVGTAAVNLLAPWAQDKVEQRKEQRAADQRLADERRRRVKEWRAGLAEASNITTQMHLQKGPAVKTYAPLLSQAWYWDFAPYLPESARNWTRDDLWDMGSQEMNEMLHYLGEEITKKAKEWGVD